jgi:LacI family transcriptional regulator
VGVLPQGIWNPFYSRLLKGVEQGLRGTAFHPMYASGEQPVEEAQAFEMLLANRVRPSSSWGDRPRRQAGDALPAHSHRRHRAQRAGLEHRCVRVENAEGGYNATRHLLDLGHRRIVHITASAGTRRDGAPAGLRARAGRSRASPLDPSLIVEGTGRAVRA